MLGVRRLAAALACHVRSSRLYGKPLQNLATGVTILDHPERFRIAIVTPPLWGAAAAPA